MTKNPDVPGSAGIRIERMLPLYEAKMIHHFDHRWATYDGETVEDVPAPARLDPSFQVLPRYWVSSEQVEKGLPSDSTHRWFLGFRDIARNTDERTFICTSFPESGVGNKLPLLTVRDQPVLLAAVLASFAADFVARAKVASTSLNFFYVKQFAVPSPAAVEQLAARIQACSLELAYTAWDMAPFAENLGDVDASGRVNPPFVWDDERRFWLRAELDASFFHLYGVARADADYIMDTFPIVRRKDEAAHGEYRTKRVILDVFDAMQQAIDAGVPYTSPISPLPGLGPRHPLKGVPGQGSQ